jgi:hypothetical protein
MVELTALRISQPQLVIEFTRMRIEVIDEGAPTCLSNLVVESVNRNCLLGLMPLSWRTLSAS